MLVSVSLVSIGGGRVWICPQCAALEIAAHLTMRAVDGWVCTCKIPVPVNDRLGEFCKLCGKPTRN
jgi:hypothetical protein